MAACTISQALALPMPEGSFPSSSRPCSLPTGGQPHPLAVLRWHSPTVRSNRGTWQGSLAGQAAWPAEGTLGERGRRFLDLPLLLHACAHQLCMRHWPETEAHRPAINSHAVCQSRVGSRLAGGKNARTLCAPTLKQSSVPVEWLLWGSALEKCTRAQPLNSSDSSATGSSSSGAQQALRHLCAYHEAVQQCGTRPQGGCTGQCFASGNRCPFGICTPLLKTLLLDLGVQVSLHICAPVVARVGAVGADVAPLGLLGVGAPHVRLQVGGRGQAVAALLADVHHQAGRGTHGRCRTCQPERTRRDRTALRQSNKQAPMAECRWAQKRRSLSFGCALPLGPFFLAKMWCVIKR